MGDYSHIKILGSYVDIKTKAENIGKGTRIANYVYIGKDTKIGKNVKINNFCEINDGCEIGDNTVINFGCVLNSNTKVGHDTIFGGQVMTADEKYMSADLSKVELKPCSIGSNCKIGQGARLISCRIGDFAVIGACAMVMDDVPPREVWVTPKMRAVKLRQTTPEEDLM